MGELFHHLSFARHLRRAAGLHPLAVEALVRGASANALGATICFWPAMEQSRASVFRRMFRLGAKDAARWESYFCDSRASRLQLISCTMTAKDFSPLKRLAFGLGTLSSEVMKATFEAEEQERNPEEQGSIDRAKTRIWLQNEFKDPKSIGLEWQPAVAFKNLDQHQDFLQYLNTTFRSMYDSEPGTDLITRWLKSLVSLVEPLSESGGIPAPGPMRDQDVANKFLGGEEKYLEAMSKASNWFVFLANRCVPLFMEGDPLRSDVHASFTVGADRLLELPDDFDVEEQKEQARIKFGEIRNAISTRGRNAKSAVPVNLLSAPRYDMDEAAGAMPAVPAATQEISMSEVEAELLQGTADGTPDASPSVTQEISSFQIEQELSRSDEISGTDIPAVQPTPMHTQEISMAEIEDELIDATEASNGVPPGEAPLAPPPTDPAGPEYTAEIHTHEIEVVMSSEEGGSLPPAVDVADALPPANNGTEERADSEVTNEPLSPETNKADVPLSSFVEGGDEEPESLAEEQETHAQSNDGDPSDQNGDEADSKDDNPLEADASAGEQGSTEEPADGLEAESETLEANPPQAVAEPGSGQSETLDHAGSADGSTEPKNEAEGQSEPVQADLAVSDAPDETDN